MALSIEYGLRSIGIVQKILLFFLKPLFWLASLKPHKRVPPITDRLLLISATKLAADIRNGKIKSEDVVQTYIKRIRDVNPILNAVVQENFQRAIQEARDVDEYLSKQHISRDKIEKEQPLLGVPITVKECCRVKGLSYAGCSLLRKGVVAEQDGDAVALLRKAGAIVLAVTNTPELCLNWETSNLLVGRTLNPYNTNRAAGGSSGGEGALIGSGSSIAGLGSDIAGSIRLPAMFNGVFGHKPTARITSLEGHYPNTRDPQFPDYLVLGPITRYAEDMKLFMKILSKGKEDLMRFNEEVDVSKLNVYYKDSAGKSIAAVDVDREIVKALHNAVEHLDKTGAKVQPADFIDMQYTVELSCANFAVIQDIPNLLQNPENPKESKNMFIEGVKAFLNLSNVTFDAIMFQMLLYTNFFIPKSKLPFYQQELENMKQLLKDTLGDNGVFIYPTFPIPAFQHNQSFVKTAGVLYPMIVNILGFPATHVPLGLNKEGLPIGIQVIAAPHQDRLCLAVAEELERKFGGWTPPTDVLA